MHVDAAAQPFDMLASVVEPFGDLKNRCGGRGWVDGLNMELVAFVIA
ncbi:MAG: hypothetical protein R2932_37030 [Caldilineaceae bacterium]